MTVLNSHARMMEIVQIECMTSTVIVSPDTQGKTVPSVRKITFIINSQSFVLYSRNANLLAFFSTPTLNANYAQGSPIIV